MVDNTTIRDGDNVATTAATKELSDGSKAPKVQLLDGSTSPTPISPATSSKQDALATLAGAVNETAPATDTASSGLNGRLQRMAQRVTSLIALVPAALTGSGNFKVAINEAIAAGTNLIGKFGIDQTTNGTTNKVFVDKPTTIDDAADVTLNNGTETLLVAVDSTRREAIIVADPANTVNIRIGKTGQVGGARGALVQPGQAFALATTAAIYGFASAASQKVSITLLKD